MNHTLGECDDDVNEMLKILEKKYGDSGKIVNVIVNEIKFAKKIGSNDPLALISFVNIIERGSRDLQKLNMKNEISNMNVISTIVEKLPEDLKLRWYRKLSKPTTSITPANKFDRLLSYLQVERDAFEYNSQNKTLKSIDERKSSLNAPAKCFIHPTTTH